SIPTSTSTPASSTPPSASLSRCSRCCLPSVARRAGWRSGKRGYSIRNRRSCGHDRSTPDRRSVTCPGSAPLRQEPEPTQAEASAGHQDDGAEGQQRHGEIELGRDSTDSLPEVAVDL